MHQYNNMAWFRSTETEPDIPNFMMGSGEIDQQKPTEDVEQCSDTKLWSSISV